MATVVKPFCSASGAAAGGIFAEGALGKLREGATYSLRTSTGEGRSGRVAFIMPPCGFCVTAELLNDALAWVTRESVGGSFEVQPWLPTYRLPHERVTQLETQWNSQLQKILKP